MEEKANILLVDDKPANLAAMQSVLDQLGQTVITARSGEKALKLLLDHDVAVILLDVNMPGIDGFETAEMIRKRERSRNVPIIFLTAHDPDSRKILKGYEMGAVDFIFKPMIADAILRYKVSVFVDLHKARLRERDLEREHQRVRELQEELEHYRSLGAKAVLPVGEAMYGSRSIKTISPSAFNELTSIYGRLLEQSLEAQALRVDYDIPGQLRRLAETMGFLRAGPRDVTEVHTEVLAVKSKDVSSARARAFVEEGRFLVLELMGHMVSFYRRHYPGSESALAELSSKSRPSADHAEGGEK